MKKIFLFILIVTISSCQSIEKNKKPSTLLSEDEMVNALTELTILKSLSTVTSGIKRNSGINTKDYIAKKIQVDSITMMDNLAYYGYNPEKLKAIYLRVHDTLEKRYVLHDSLKEKYMKDYYPSKGYNKFGDNKEVD